MRAQCSGSVVHPLANGWGRKLLKTIETTANFAAFELNSVIAAVFVRQLHLIDTVAHASAPIQDGFRGRDHFVDVGEG